MEGLRILWPWPAKYVARAHTLPQPLIIPLYRIPNRISQTCNLPGTDILSDLSLHFGLTSWFFLAITLFPFRKEPTAKYFLDYWIFPLCLGGWSVASLRCSSCCRPVKGRNLYPARVVPRAKSIFRITTGKGRGRCNFQTVTPRLNPLCSPQSPDYFIVLPCTVCPKSHLWFQPNL